MYAQEKKSDFGGHNLKIFFLNLILCQIITEWSGVSGAFKVSFLPGIETAQAQHRIYDKKMSGAQSH